MKVKELIEELSKLDKSLEVYGYSDLEEAGDSILGAVVKKEFPYCGGDKPEDLPEEFVLLWVG